MAQGRPTGSGQQDEERRCGWSLVLEHQLEQCVQRGEGTRVAEVYRQPTSHLRIIKFLFLTAKTSVPF